MGNKPKGVMIVGMEMPKDCEDCPFLVFHGYQEKPKCLFGKRIKNGVNKPRACPLQEEK